jgi:glycosyltransferase involved in cell wall biosynthesis
MTRQNRAVQGTKTSLISVIMPCYNAGAHLREAVDSVLNQTYPHIELIVIDDGSTDHSLDILQSYGDRIKVLIQANQGPYPARNHGLAHAAGEYVAFLDADDWWSLDCLEKLYAALVAHPECALAYCGWQHVGAINRSNEPFVPKNYEEPDKIEQLLTGGSPWPIHAALTRKAMVDRINGFREDLSTSLDYELWLRLAAANPVILVPQVLAFYRFHGTGQISSQPWRQAVNGWRIKRRFLQENPEAARGLGVEKITELVDRGLLNRGYHFYWQRDLRSAQRVFRKCLTVGGWRWRDLIYLLPTLMPETWYRFMIQTTDQQRNP